uniref:Inositol-tetrakisphosphate 1-kinase n=1 Tax=Jaculus jaculus TaxID=51337 RepID=A0A8C5LM89_JACJA
MQTFLKGKRVGYWLSEKKIKKLNFQAFAELCRKRVIEVLELNLSRPIEEQGPLDVIIHKLTDIILEADQNDSQSLELVHRFQYIDAHPKTIILDPLPAIRTLLNRSKSYELIRKIEAYMKDDRICSPPFMELRSLCGDTMRLLEQTSLAFPFICKTRVAHGTNSHDMAIIFNKEGLSAIEPPCVVQNFINHNAVLYKVFVVGELYTVVQRPSHNVSKPELSSVLTELNKIEGVFERPTNNQTGQHAVIDVNAFPGYEDPLNHIATVLQGQSTGSPADGRTCSTSPGCCSSLKGQDAPWKTEADSGSLGLPHQRLGCTAGVSPSSQQHCVASLATKASSQ